MATGGYIQALIPNPDSKSASTFRVLVSLVENLSPVAKVLPEPNVNTTTCFLDFVLNSDKLTDYRSS